MKAGEVKIKLSNAAINMIDTYFGGSSISEKFINSTLKILLKQNLYKLDTILDMFTNQDGEIDVTEIVTEYSKIIDDNGFVLDIRQYINNDMIKSFIPDKVLVIKREDIFNLLL